ncbi:MAG: hypothetical protein CSB44_03050 [Gammaproteobacteria bacterium]|nr:MAG: hypothetical protein CSB44_03050 [Gammaproteobacteria bacterium]PIE36636.1 MAG: hypothetical protein CSA54_03845 [Gammaproteobacteria bacterium]
MHQTLQKAVTKALLPLVRLLLRHGVSHAEFANWVRQAYVDQAHEHFGIDGKPPSISRIAIVTGINRKEVKRLRELPEDIDTGVSKHNRAVRVVTGWLQDPAFLDGDGEPRTLEYGDPDDGFNQLVKRHGGDVPARAMLDELERVGTVTVEGNVVTLCNRGYVPAESEEAMLDLFATSAADLLDTLDHNLASPGARLQMSVAYDNVPKSGRDRFRLLASKRAMEFLRMLDAELSSHDRDRHPELQMPGQGRYRSGIGIYLIEQELEPKENNRDE